MKEDTGKDKYEERRSGSEDKRSKEYRCEFMRDESRIVHSFAFRRLQGKTQIFGPEQGDFHRNRMTHSLEVASIGRSIAAHLKCLCKEKRNQAKVKGRALYNDCYDLLNPVDNENQIYDYLISSICLLHDVGHLICQHFSGHIFKELHELFRTQLATNNHWSNAFSHGYKKLQYIQKLLVLLSPWL